MSLNYSYNKIIKYVIKAECQEPLHIGSAEGSSEEVLIHPVDRIPFIQASSIAGVFRSYYEQAYGDNGTGDLFGDRKFTESTNASEKGSKIRFSDGRFENKGRDLKLELRPRVSIDPVNGTCKASIVKGTSQKSGHKFNMEYISAGAEFVFEIYLYDARCKDQIEDILTAMNQGIIQIGGQKSNGCGYIKVTKALCREFDMTKPEDRKLWYEEEELSEENYKEITTSLQNKSKMKNAFEILLEGHTEGELLVKSISTLDVGQDAADSENIRNGKGDYIIPGSSFKGALRAQMEKIAAYLSENGTECEAIIEDAFGKRGTDDYSGKIGNLFVYDTVVGDREENDVAPLKRRIHIDKFTGGVIHGGLFSEKNVFGDLNLRLTIRNKNFPEKTCGILVMALRDLAIGAMNLGSGYNIGKGMISVKKIVVKDCRDSEKVAVLDFENNRILDENQIISQCLAAVQEV